MVVKKMTIKPFNLSKQSRRYPSKAFDPFDLDKKDPYRLNTGKPGYENPSDKQRMFSQPSPGSPLPGGGSGQFENDKNWPPSDENWLVDEEGRPRHDNGEGAQTPFGSDLHDNADPHSNDSVIGINSTVQRQIDDNHRDRKPYNVNSHNGVLREVRRRIRSLNNY